MKSKFSFFKAGQGLFYGGRICNYETEKVFTIVYDCGTSPFIAGNNQSLNKEIGNFKDSTPCFPDTDKIDILFLSHLDYDHVSGVKRLLEDFKVESIVLPYIDFEYRKYFLMSVLDVNESEGSLSSEEYAEYVLFIENPHQFIEQKSEETKIYFINSNDNPKIEYLGYGNEGQPEEDIYPRGTELDKNTINELKDTSANVSLYSNNLQFFIEQNWEFTTYVKSVEPEKIKELYDCLKEKLNKEIADIVSLESFENLDNSIRKKARACYVEHIKDINAHGLVLLHGPICFEHLDGVFYVDCDLNCFQNNRHFCYDYHCCKGGNQPMLGTLLFGDTSINPANNSIDFPPQFKDKLKYVHVVQIPHHGSSKDWDFSAFKGLKIGEYLTSPHRMITVCNFGFGNRYGHPSHQVLYDLRRSIFLNTQFSRLDVEYHCIRCLPVARNTKVK